MAGSVVAVATHHAASAKGQRRCNHTPSNQRPKGKATKLALAKGLSSTHAKQKGAGKRHGVANETRESRSTSEPGLLARLTDREVRPCCGSHLITVTQDHLSYLGKRKLNPASV